MELIEMKGVIFMIWQEIALNGQQKHVPCPALLVLFEVAVTPTATPTPAFATVAATISPVLVTTSIPLGPYFIGRTERCEKQDKNSS